MLTKTAALFVCCAQGSLFLKVSEELLSNKTVQQVISLGYGPWKDVELIWHAKYTEKGIKFSEAC